MQAWLSSASTISSLPDLESSHESMQNTIICSGERRASALQHVVPAQVTHCGFPAQPTPTQSTPAQVASPPHAAEPPLATLTPRQRMLERKRQQADERAAQMSQVGGNDLQADRSACGLLDEHVTRRYVCRLRTCSAQPTQSATARTGTGFTPVPSITSLATLVAPAPPLPSRSRMCFELM